jgi:uncharacterized membrane protein
VLTAPRRRPHLPGLLPALAIAGLGVLAAGGSVAHADDTLSVTTPFPTIETQPGSSVTFDLAVASNTPEVVDLDVAGVPKGWDATLRGGGFVIHSITSAPHAGAAAELEIAVAQDAAPGDYPVTVTGTDAGGTKSVSTVTLSIADRVNSGVRLSADFPSLSGDPGSTFTYNLTVTNDTPAEQTFTFDPSGPQGWDVSASPTAESQAATVTIDAGGEAGIKVTATPPESADQGSYPIDVAVVGANGGKGAIELEAQVTGTPELALGTADERLDVSGSADHEKRIPMIVANTGSAPLEAVKMAGTAPTDWEISFDPEQIDAVQPGETAQVTAIVKPSSDAVAGDYSLTVRSSAGSLSSSVDLRYSLGGSRTLGVVAIAVIVAALAALGVVFVKFGRR